MFIKNSSASVILTASRQTYSVDKTIIYKAVDRVHDTIKKINAFDVDIISILGLRNLSAFVGELFVASMAVEANGLFKKNPNQDGYPDLLFMNEEGLERWNYLVKHNKIKEKEPFSPFLTGGIEVKATCGAIPTAAECLKKNLERPGIGDERIDFLRGYDWKAHHRETNQLLGIFWDFVNGSPTIVAIFYSNDLTQEDWGEIVHPHEGGGRTTSVSIMTKEGIKKMYDNWIMITDDKRYARYFNKRNKDNKIPQ